MTGVPDPLDAGGDSEEDTLDRLAALLDEFEAERDRGARPSVDDWVARAGPLGPRLRPLLESLGVVSDAGRAVDELARVTTRGLERTVSTVGPYRIEAELGRGGMGVVYLAREPETERAIALKVLPLGPVPDQDAVARFRREAHAAARLEHPNIVAVHTIGEDQGTLYYAMQVVDGCSLEQLIRRLSGSRPTRSSQVTAQVDARGAVAWATATREAETSASPCQLDPRAAARLALGVARALGFAHAAGILHRDVKPANVLVDSGGVARLTDFGLCRLVDHVGLTRTGDIVGTLRYMAPEQIEGEATPRSDVYALGMTLYELLALRPAFEATRRASLLRDILYTEPPRLAALDRRVPRDLSAIVEKATAKVEARRYPSAADLADDLETFLDGRPIAARPRSTAYRLRLWFERHRWTAAALLAALVALAALGVRYGVDLRREGALRRAETYVAHLVAAEAALQAGSIARAESQLDLAPEELRAWEWRHLHARLEQRTFATPPAFPGHGILALEASPDGTRAVVVSQVGLTVIDATEGAVLARRELAVLRTATWSVDGQRIFAALEEGQLHVLDPSDLSTRATLAAPARIDHLLATPGDLLFFATEPGSVGTISARSGSQKALAELDIRCLDLCMDGANRSLVVLGADGTLRWIGPNRRSARVTRHGDTMSFTGWLDVEGRRAIATTKAGAVLVHDLDSGQLLTAPVTGTVARSVALERDSDLLAAAVGARIRLWPASGLGAPHDLVGHGSPVNRITFVAGRGRLLSGDFQGQVLGWDLAALRATTALRGHLNDVFAIAIHPSGDKVASGGRDGLVFEYDLTRGGARRLVCVGLQAVTGLAYIDGGRRLVGCEWGGTVVALDAATGEVLARRPLAGAERIVADVGGERCLVPCELGVVVLGADLEPLPGESFEGLGAARRLLLDPAGRWLAAADRSGVVTLVDRDTRRVRESYRVFGAPVAGLAYDAESGILVAAAGTSQVARIDVAARRILAPIETASRENVGEIVIDVAITGRPARLFAGTVSGRVLVHDLRSARRLVDLAGQADVCLVVAADPRHERVFVGGSDPVLTVLAPDNTAASEAPSDAPESMREEQLQAYLVHAAYAAMYDADEARLARSNEIVRALRRSVTFDCDSAWVFATKSALHGREQEARSSARIAAREYAARRARGDIHGVHPITRLTLDPGIALGVARVALTAFGLAR